jgi:O-succinylbenzoate synthase
MWENFEKIEYAPYILQPKSRLGSAGSKIPREGALLKVRFSDRKVGYSDCHPWPELGDLPLRLQLSRLALGRPSAQVKYTELRQSEAGWTSILRQSLQMARTDAEARFAGKSLWEDLAIPRSHALWTDVSQVSSLETVAKQGFRKVKIKVGSRISDELDLLRQMGPELKENGLQVRLDLNGALPLNQVDEFFERLEPILNEVDWVEDPTAYRVGVWSRIQAQWKVRLALDRGSENWGLTSGVSVRVLKPAIQDWNLTRVGTNHFPGKVKITAAAIVGGRLSVTSYLDHPIGQVSAAWAAAQMQNLEDCGLVSHLAYEMNPFSERLEVRNGVLVPPQTGTGWGWDDLLEQQPWRDL